MTEVQQTIELIRKQAEQCELEPLSDVLLARFRMGQSEYGATNHLRPWVDHALEGLQELMDRWMYLVLQQRRGMDVEQARISSAAQQLIIEIEWLPKCDMPLRFFISGPYNALADSDTCQHIRRAAQMKAALMRRGHYTYCPHTESAHFELAHPDITRQAHLDNCIGWLEYSQAMMMLPQWEQSEGASLERGYAFSKGLPAYDDILAVPVYLDGVLAMWASEAD